MSSIILNINNKRRLNVIHSTVFLLLRYSAQAPRLFFLLCGEEIAYLGEENFFHADYDATLASVYGSAANPDNLVVEGGVVD